jgi:hypothetical protein
MRDKTRDRHMGSLAIVPLRAILTQLACLSLRAMCFVTAFSIILAITLIALGVPQFHFTMALRDVAVPDLLLRMLWDCAGIYDFQIIAVSADNPRLLVAAFHTRWLTALHLLAMDIFFMLPAFLATLCLYERLVWRADLTKCARCGEGLRALRVAQCPHCKAPL